MQFGEHPSHLYSSRATNTPYFDTTSPHPQRPPQFQYTRPQFSIPQLIAYYRHPELSSPPMKKTASQSQQVQVSQTVRELQPQTEQEPSESEIAASANWSLIQQSVHQQNVWRNVRRFIDKMKDVRLKKRPPDFVMEQLEPRIKFWDGNGQGWNPYRPDVIFCEIVQFIFNATAIFLFSTRAVLYKVNMDIFPILYIIALLIGAYYRCNTKILYRHKVIVKRREILVHYLVWHSIVDGTVIYLSLLQYFDIDTNWYRLIIFLKAVQNNSIIHKLEPVALITKYWKYTYRIFVVYIHIIFIAHCAALMFIAMVSKDKTPNWMEQRGLSRDMDHWMHVYIRAFYWALTTLILASYGDLTPTRTKEIVVVTLVEIFGLALMAYWLNTLQSIYTEFKIDSISDQRNTLLISRFLEKNKVPYSVQKRVKKTVHKFSQADIIRETEEQNQIMDKMPPFTKGRLLQFVHSKPMSMMTLWNRFSKIAIKKIATFIQRRLYYGMQIIIGQLEIPNQYFMIRNGRATQTYHDKRRKVTIVRQVGKVKGILDKLNRLEAPVPKHYLWLGLQNSIIQSPSPVSIRSKGQSMILSIKYETLQKILKQSRLTKDYQNFCVLRDQIRQDGIKIDQEPCLHCEGRGHNILQCHFYHYIPKKQYVILRYIHRKQLTNLQQLKKQIHQQRVKDERRPRFPWVKIQAVDLTKGNTIIGSMAANFRLGKALPKYCEGRLRQIKKYGKNADNINDYLTTIKQADSPFEWSAYFTKWNATHVKIRKV